LSQIVLAPAALTGLQSVLPDSDHQISALAPELVAELRVPPRPARHGSLARPVHPLLQDALSRQGIHELYSHQAEAIDSVLAGQDTLIVSPTASGKTLCYNLPVLESHLQSRPARALYLFPLKALAQDQLRSLRELSDCLLPPLDAALYDGDTSQAERKRLWQRPPHVLLTNPDMLHYGLLPYHSQKWSAFFSELRFVVLDEVHTYRGIFGAHMAQVLRRLHRVLRHHGAEPVFVLCSATIGNPGELARCLLGREARVIDGIGSPSPGMRLFVLNPISTSLHTLACRLTIACVRAGLKCITFTKARRITELIYTWIEQQAPDLCGRISSYRSGFLPEERREIEGKLFSGQLDAVVSTSALEVGIDVGGLDACILVGYPGSIAATFQRAGRVGRGRREGLVFLIAGQDALDQYFVRNPEEILRRGFEPAVVDPALPNVLGPHLLSASAERALRMDEAEYEDLPVEAAARELVRAGRLDAAPGPGGLHFSREPYPQKEVDLRGSGDTFTVLDTSEGAERVVGSISGFRAYVEGHAGAVYLHRGQSYLVSELDLDRKDIHARPAEVPYYTQALFDKHTEILGVERSRPLGNVVARFGRLRVTTTIHSFQKRRVRGQELLSTHPLELPPHVLETLGLWWEIDPELGAALSAAGGHLMGSLHATEHCAIGLMPLFALCDRLDLGGICYPQHPQLGKSVIFLYDGHAGGMGLAARGYALGEELLRETLRAIAGCACEAGCPSCIQSPRCGSGNKPLDKPGAAELVRLMLGDRPISPARAAAGDPPAQAVPALRAEAQLEPPPARIVVFDVETQRSAQEVGGWHNAHLMRVAVAVAYDSSDGGYHVFSESEVDGLVRLLQAADLVVGFNVLKFDYEVLRAYSGADLRKLPTLDLFDELARASGRRTGLGDLGRLNLGSGKSADGLQSLRWFREGRIEEVISYCKADVELTLRLFELGQRQGAVEVPGKGRIPVRWDLPQVLQRLARPDRSGPEEGPG
jgi:DEAD/DEAH box helicase domain-containing protein